ncbi:hypothetical protein ACWGIA_06055 [Streptomyces bobili]
MELEREQWAIFARWNERRVAGEVGAESHPDTGGIDARYDELEQLRAPHRQAPTARVGLWASYGSLPTLATGLRDSTTRIGDVRAGEVAVDH